MFSHIITYDLSLPCRLGLSLICAFICGRVLTMTEKLLRYHRPILEDGEIRYDFFYEQGQTMIHPALDRCCFILEHDGVKIHWLTDRERDSTDADPANRIVEADAQRGPRPLPLMQNEWNALSLKLTIEQQQDGVRVSLDKNKGLQHLQPRVQVKGDFDIEVQFRDLKIDDVYNKRPGSLWCCSSIPTRAITAGFTVATRDTPTTDSQIITGYCSRTSKQTPTAIWSTAAHQSLKNPRAAEFELHAAAELCLPCTRKAIHPSTEL